MPIYEAGESDGHLYIAMRYVEGTDLRALLNSEGRLEPERALAIAGQVGGALDAAHIRGLVHRDVKPGNILIAADPGLETFCATRDSKDAVAALLARGIAAAPCNDGADLLRDTDLAGVGIACDYGKRVDRTKWFRRNGARGLTLDRRHSRSQDRQPKRCNDYQHEDFKHAFHFQVSSRANFSLPFSPG